MNRYPSLGVLAFRRAVSANDRVGPLLPREQTVLNVGDPVGERETARVAGDNEHGAVQQQHRWPIVEAPSRWARKAGLPEE
jgi:hypothetical protein